MATSARVAGMKAFMRIAIPPTADHPYLEPVMTLEIDTHGGECTIVEPLNEIEIGKINLDPESDLVKLMEMACNTERPQRYNLRG